MAAAKTAAAAQAAGAPYGAGGAKLGPGAKGHTRLEPKLGLAAGVCWRWLAHPGHLALAPQLRGCETIERLPPPRTSARALYEVERSSVAR